jgi:hypothetical protein
MVLVTGSFFIRCVGGLVKMGYPAAACQGVYWKLVCPICNIRFIAGRDVICNSGFIYKEVFCIVRSISKWTARHMTADGLREWGEPGRQKSLQVR